MDGSEWSDWVVRLPQPQSNEGWLLAVLLVSFTLFALVKGLISVGDRLWPALNWLMIVAGLFLVVLFFNRFQTDDADDGPAGTILVPIEEGDCGPELLTPCPPVPEPGTPVEG